MHPTVEPLLALVDLRAGYDGEEKLHGASISLCAGRLTAIIGPNGSGKSTLLKCAAGQLRPSAGELRLMSRSMSDFHRLERAQAIAYMPQSRLTPEIPVRQLVMHGRYPHLKWGRRPGSEDQRIVKDALARVGLSNSASRSVHTLSGGERQRAYIAMMLAQQARVMLLDEPTTYLDPSGQFELMALLRALCAEGIGVAVVLHDLALAMRYADRICVMESGRVVMEDAPDAVFLSGVLQRIFRVDALKLEGHYLFVEPAYETGKGW